MCVHVTYQTGAENYTLTNAVCVTNSNMLSHEIIGYLVNV